MKTFETPYEILPESQKWLWPSLSPTKILGFVLYGGTALALRLGHRQSIDFDFFSEKPIDIDLLKSALPILKDPAISSLRRSTPQSISVEILSPARRIVKISFFGTIKFGRLKNPELTDDKNLLVASFEDIFSLKLKTLLQRASYKDYKDVVELLRAGFKLKDGLEGAMAIFGTMFSPAIAIRDLNYFADVYPPLNKEEQALLKRVTKDFLDQEMELNPAKKVSESLTFLSSKALLTTRVDWNFASIYYKNLGLGNLD